MTPSLLTASSAVTVESLPSWSSRRWPLMGLSLAMLMASLDTSIANAALPLLARALQTSFHEVQWIVLAYLLPLTAAIVVAGRLGDLLGRRRLLLMGLAVFTGASFVCGVAPTLPVLLVARGVQGLGAAAMMALSVALVSDVLPKTMTGRAMGVLGSMSAIGTTVGPALGGVLAARLGWGAIFLVNVPLGLAALWLIRGVPADTPLPKVTPLLDVAMFRDATVRTSLILSAVVSAVMMTTLVVGPFHLSRALGLSTAVVGLAMSVGPLVAAIAGIPAGRVVDRVGTQRTSVAGLAGLSVGAGVVSVMPTDAGVWGYLVPLCGMTASYAVFQAANTTALMTRIDRGRRGVAAGALSLARNLGLIAGVAAMGAVFSFASGDVTTAPASSVAAGTRLTFGLTAVIMGAAAGAAWTRRAPAPHAP